MAERVVKVGAVAYDLKVMTIWEAMRDYFREAGFPDYVLFSNYEAQVEALFAREIDVASNTNVAYVRCEERAGDTHNPNVDIPMGANNHPLYVVHQVRPGDRRRRNSQCWAEEVVTPLDLTVSTAFWPVVFNFSLLRNAKAPSEATIRRREARPMRPGEPASFEWV